jgi:hypothetical protein
MNIGDLVEVTDGAYTGRRGRVHWVRQSIRNRKLETVYVRLDGSDQDIGSGQDLPLYYCDLRVVTALDLLAEV